MKLIQLGKISLLSKIKDFFVNIGRNCKFEFGLAFVGIVWIACAEKYPDIQQLVATYFSESRCSGIAGYTSIVIGIYVTIWSIFATSASKINAELLKKRVEGQVFFIISFGLLEAFVTTLLCIFVPATTVYYSDLIMISTCMTMVSFVKLVIVVMMVSKLNIGYIVKEIDTQNAQYTDIKVKLDEIYHRLVSK